MKKVKYAIIGFGGIAENRIAKEGFACDVSRFSVLPNAQLVGAFDVNPKRKKAAEALGLKWYSSVEKLLADPQIQAVYVATNNATHAPLVLKALAAGKHAIVEKPIATTLRDASAMVAAAKKMHLSLSIDHMMVNNAYNKMAKKAIQAGKIGTVNDCCVHMECLYGTTPEEAATWRCSKVEEMGGPVGDMASHCIYVAEYLCGTPIVAVQAVYYPKTVDIIAENGAYVKFFMANGCTGSIRAAFSEPRGGDFSTLSNLGYEFYGSAGTLRGYGTMFQLSGRDDEPYHQRLECETPAGVKSLHPRKFENIYQQIIMKHAQSILDGKPLNAQDGLRNFKVCQAIHRSARAKGKKVEVRG